MTERDDTKRRRAELKHRYGLAYRQLSEILFTQDPIGIRFETNTDEYEPEVDTILPRLRTCSDTAEVNRVVHEEFVRWFGTSEAGPSAKYQTIAKKIWAEVLPYLFS